MDIKGILADAAAGVGLLDGVVKAGKSAMELFKGGDISEKEIALKSKILELIEQAMASKESYTKLRDAFGELERENLRLQQWNEERKNYELRETHLHSFAYRKKAELSGGEPSPYLCASCFDRSEKSILQLEQDGFGSDLLKCPRCGSTVRVKNNTRMSVDLGPVGKGRGWDV